MFAMNLFLCQPNDVDSTSQQRRVPSINRTTGCCIACIHYLFNDLMLPRPILTNVLKVE